MWALMSEHMQCHEQARTQTHTHTHTRKHTPTATLNTCSLRYKLWLSFCMGFRWITFALIIQRPLSSLSDLLNHHHRAAGHGFNTPAPLHHLAHLLHLLYHSRINPFLFITYNLICSLFPSAHPAPLQGLPREGLLCTQECRAQGSAR